jgi:hypothetical protein
MFIFSSPQKIVNALILKLLFPIIGRGIYFLRYFGAISENNYG